MRIYIAEIVLQRKSLKKLYLKKKKRKACPRKPHDLSLDI